MRRFDVEQTKFREILFKLTWLTIIIYVSELNKSIAENWALNVRHQLVPSISYDNQKKKIKK